VIAARDDHVAQSMLLAVLAQERIEMRVGSKHRDVLSQDISRCIIIKQLQDYTRILEVVGTL